mmetsp:Transcript_46846/g.138453  ORF Transcript_46846/g.138453 Transcript_46846/m.138453 type:complete len:223 (-) Transcript_46846:96-764(-)
MDCLRIRHQAELLEAITESLLETAKTTPDVLLKPTVEKVECVKRWLHEMIDAVERQSPDATVAASDEADLCSLETEVGALLAKFQGELDEQPWHNPPSLRKMRQTCDAVSEKVSDLRERREKVFPGRQIKEVERQAGAATPAMADDFAGARPRDVGMSVDAALAMLMDQKQGGYRGGLCGIVHAAGVQEVTAIPAYTPGRFEFAFAPKTAAAYNLHQFSVCM